VSNVLIIIKNIIELRKLWPFKLQGVKTQNNKPPNATKASSKAPKKFLVCYSIAIKIPT
jgi:hypothetical protein